jgi:hypothetical protein
LIAAIPELSLADSLALATEAGKRRLVTAIPSLETSETIEKRRPIVLAGLMKQKASCGGRDEDSEPERYFAAGILNGRAWKPVTWTVRLSGMRRTSPSIGNATQ